MHKIFAKTQILGKNVVFLPQCHSTNQEARAMNMTGRLQHGSIVWTDYQISGRGQQGNAWLSERGKNLLFTLTIKPDSLTPNKQYLLNLVASLAIHRVLVARLPTCLVEFKWPNDMYVDDNKIAGVLIETTISKGALEHVYCGIGLNVNQSHFNLPAATSLRMILGEESDRETILEELLLAFEEYYSFIENPSVLIDKYKKHLRWFGELRTYKIGKEIIEGVIRGINDHGKLELQIGNISRVLDVKEIEFLH